MGIFPWFEVLGYYWWFFRLKVISCLFFFMHIRGLLVVQMFAFDRRSLAIASEPTSQLSQWWGSIDHRLGKSLRIPENTLSGCLCDRRASPTGALSITNTMIRYTGLETVKMNGSLLYLRWSVTKFDHNHCRHCRQGTIRWVEMRCSHHSRDKLKSTRALSH